MRLYIHLSQMSHVCWVSSELQCPKGGNVTTHLRGTSVLLQVSGILVLCGVCVTDCILSLCLFVC